MASRCLWKNNTKLTKIGVYVHKRRKGSVVGRHHGEGGARAYNGGLGARAPSGVQGQSPWSVCKGGKAPWSWKHFGHWMSNGADKFSTSSWKQYGLLRSTGVRVGGGQSAWCPQPRHWGACTPPAPPPMFTSIHLCAVHGTEARYAVLVSHKATGLGCLTA